MTESSHIASEILTIIEYWEQKLASYLLNTITKADEQSKQNYKNNPVHLIDSTSNNTTDCSFFSIQQTQLDFPKLCDIWDNDRWIAIQDYQNEDLDIPHQFMEILTPSLLPCD